MYRALPVADFTKESVSFAGKDWEIRYDKLAEKLTVHKLPEAKDNNKSENVWERTNSWMLNIAFEKGGDNMTLIALWDGKGGDGKGGTQQMLNIAKEKGATIIIIDINKI